MGRKADLADLILFKSGCISLHSYSQSKPSRSYESINFIKICLKRFVNFIPKAGGAAY